MELEDIRKAIKDKTPVILLDNVFKEREELFGKLKEGFKTPTYNLKDLIGGIYTIHSLETPIRPCVRLNGMDLMDDKGNKLKSFEIIIPTTSIKIA